jgi:hypothetical protein
VHFPRNANLSGDFVYRVTPIFMDAEDRLNQVVFGTDPHSRASHC